MKTMDSHHVFRRTLSSSLEVLNHILLTPVQPSGCRMRAIVLAGPAGFS
jgi:hypothetical protein